MYDFIYNYLDKKDISEFDGIVKKLSGKYYIDYDYNKILDYIYNTLVKDKKLKCTFYKDSSNKIESIIFNNNKIMIHNVYYDFKNAFEEIYNKKKYKLYNDNYNSKIKSLQQLLNIIGRSKSEFKFNNLYVSGNPLIKNYDCNELFYYILFKKNILFAFKSKLDVIKVYETNGYKINEITNLDTFNYFREKILMDLTDKKYNYISNNILNLKSIMSEEEINSKMKYDKSIFQSLYEDWLDILFSYQFQYEDNLDIIKNVLVVKTLK
jgi:hypothetical protein